MFIEYRKSTDHIRAKKRVEHLNNEIELYQSRINGMGLDGDCAYERALIKVYNDLLVQRSSELKAMHTVLPV